MRGIGLLLVLVGGAVFSPPFWLPRVADVTVQADTFTRAGQVGGALIGLGIAVAVIGLFRRLR